MANDWFCPVLIRKELYGAPKDDLRIAPLLASSHAGLAPAFMQVMELDHLRDEGLFYERALREAGVPTKLVLYVRPHLNLL